MGNKKITLQNVKSFLQGKSRRILNEFNLLSPLKQEQAYYRSIICRDSCPKECEYCGCETPGKWFVDYSCNDGEKFPDMMEKEEWEKFKLDKQKFRKEILEKLIEHIDYYNNLAPFPLWDSFYTDIIKKELKMNKINYDAEPVECCKFCKNIHMLPDEHGNYICTKCNNVVNDDIELFDNIFDYIDAYGDIWGMKYNKDGEETGKHKDEQETLL